MKKGGAVKKAVGGSAGKGYKGFPFSPTSEVKSTVSGRKKGGVVYKRGGRVRGLAAGGAAGDGENGEEPEGMQFGGGTFGSMGAPQPSPQQMGGLGGILGNIPGRTPQGPIQGPPTVSGRPMIPAQPVTVPMPPTLASFRARPAPGTTPGFKRGGGVHSDEAEDKKLFKKMYKEEEAKEEKGRKRGGAVGELGGSNRSGGTVLGSPGANFKVGSVPSKSVPKGHKSVLAGERYESWGKGRARGGVVNPGTPSKARGLAGSSYKQWGKGYAAGGVVKTPLTNTTGGGGGGLGRLAKTKAAARVPDKTEA
jgi:hypothetical protein